MSGGTTHGARLSMFVWAVYLGAVGGLFLAVPESVTDLFGIDAPRDVWIRVVGIATLVAAAYYFGAAIHRARWMFWYSVPVRIAAAVGLAVLGVTEGVWQLWLFAAVDLVGAGWTFAALRWKPAPEPLEPTASD